PLWFVSVADAVLEPKKGPTLLKLGRAHNHYTRALHLEEQKKFKEAIAEHGQALSQDPAHSFAYFWRGVLHATARDNAKQSADFAKASELNPKLVFAFYNLACTEALQKKSASALAALEKALQAGYRKFATIAKDADLDSIRKDPVFPKLIATYEKEAK